MLPLKPISNHVLIGTFVDMIVLPFKTRIYNTARVAKHLSSYLKTLHLDSAGVANCSFQPNRLLGLAGH